MMTDSTLYQAIAQAAGDINQQAAEAFDSDLFRLIYTMTGTFLASLITLGMGMIPFFMRRLELRAEEGKKARDRIQLLLGVNRRDRKLLETLIRNNNQRAMDVVEDAIAKISVLEGNLEKQVEIGKIALEQVYSHLHKIKDSEIKIRENRHEEGA